MGNLILVKLGGSLITNKSKPFTEEPGIIKRLVKEIHQARQQIQADFLVGHGGGSYPHVPARKYRTAEGIINQKSFWGIAEVQDAAARLNRIVVREFLAVGEKAVSINPSSCLVTKNREIKNFFLEPLIKLLEFKMLPVVYGDVVLDEKQGCSILSTEKILDFLALRLQKKGWKVLRIVHCGKTDGVYDDKGNTIPKINLGNFAKIKRFLGGSDGVDVTGGMLHKVKECLKLARFGVNSLIVNGKRPGGLTKAILGEEVKGTLISINYKKDEDG
jgi:isopentenyl phosphate kinase